MTQPSLSVVIPAFNEAVRLPDALPRLLAVTDPDRTELIVVDDGSSDATASVARTCLDQVPNASVLRREHRGKGAAVREGVMHASGDVIAFVDADMASDPGDLQLLIEATAEADVAIGSRAVRGSTTEAAPLARVLLGRAFNSMVRATTRLNFRDTQCGFKAFRAPAATQLFGSSRVDGFAFDVEILSIAARLGYRVVEVPVQWRMVDGSHVSPVFDSARMAADLLVVAWGARRLHEPLRPASALPPSGA